MNRVLTRRRWWRRAVAWVANAFRLVVLRGLQSWRRDLSLTAPALGSISLLLVLVGAIGLGGMAIAQLAIQQSKDASLLTVYLAPSASDQAIGDLEARLRADARVVAVDEVSAEQALREARAHPGLGDLAGLAADNPFAASLRVRVRMPTQVAGVASGIEKDPAVDPGYPTSYDAAAYSSLAHIVLAAGGASLAVLLLLAFIAYTVCANSLRTIALARRDELQLIRLLGARRWMLRGPFVIEGLMTGALGGVAAGVAVLALWLALAELGTRTYTDLLPGVTERAVEVLVASLITAGMLMGSVAASFGVRRLTG